MNDQAESSGNLWKILKAIGGIAGIAAICGLAIAMLQLAQQIQSQNEQNKAQKTEVAFDQEHSDMLSTLAANQSPQATYELPTQPAPEEVSALSPSDNSPTATPKPETKVISIWGIEENGAKINVNQSCVYNIEYLGDAYSPWPNENYEDYQGWTTITRIYLNRSVEWGLTDYGLVGPVNHDYYLGLGGYYLDKTDAIESSKGDSRTFVLNEGDYIVVVLLDEQGRYSDNRGKVDVGITCVEHR